MHTTQQRLSCRPHTHTGVDMHAYKLNYITSVPTMCTSVPTMGTSVPILCTYAHPLSLYMQVCLYENQVKCLTCVAHYKCIGTLACIGLGDVHMYIV